MKTTDSTIMATAIADGDSRTATTDVVRSLREGLHGADPALVLVFASTTQPLAEVLPQVVEAFPTATVLGSSTAGEFTETTVAKGSVSAIAVAGQLQVHAGLGEGISTSPAHAVAAAVELLPRKVEGLPHRTAILLLDPLSGVSEETTLLAAGALETESPIALAGGAAGDDLSMRETLVGCGAQVARDAVVVATIHSAKPMGIGVHHGHRPLSSPLAVTRAQGNTVMEIEGRPAWTVWAEQTAEHAAAEGIDPQALDPQDVGAFLLRYEAGLANGNAYKIRAPLSRGPDGSLDFACGIPQGAVIRITESTPARQVQAARQAARQAREQLGGAEPAGAIVFDCICRNLILGETFDQAVRGMSDELGGVPLAGFETYGEIALDVGDMSGFHNTTTVVLAFAR